MMVCMMTVLRVIFQITVADSWVMGQAHPEPGVQNLDVDNERYGWVLPIGILRKFSISREVTFGKMRKLLARSSSKMAPNVGRAEGSGSQHREIRFLTN
jgi:hypothetical protein